ncbi:hypothetical protein ACQ5SO_14330 [Rhodovulum sp. DZ06]|uniref:hypothetical protein n=1 Tax=Rhodovulum sp. DZ06 TaxID=3425126 RepID=UPI003D326B45
MPPAPAPARSLPRSRSRRRPGRLPALALAALLTAGCAAGPQAPGYFDLRAAAEAGAMLSAAETAELDRLEDYAAYKGGRRLGAGLLGGIAGGAVLGGLRHGGEGAAGAAVAALVIGLQVAALASNVDADYGAYSIAWDEAEEDGLPDRAAAIRASDAAIGAARQARDVAASSRAQTLAAVEAGRPAMTEAAWSAAQARTILVDAQAAAVAADIARMERDADNAPELADMLYGRINVLSALQREIGGHADAIAAALAAATPPAAAQG